MAINNGGSAFPYHGPRNVNLGSGPALVLDTFAPGMSLRAWLAGRVLPALARCAVLGQVGDYSPENVALDACRCADALIAELEK